MPRVVSVKFPFVPTHGYTQATWYNKHSTFFVLIIISAQARLPAYVRYPELE